VAGIVLRPNAPTAATPTWLPSLASALALSLSAFLLTLVLLLGAWASLPRLVFGWDAATIVSGSMEPALRPGDVVLMEPHDGTVPGEGDIISFRDRGGRLVTHRVAEVLPDRTLRTQGDANAAPDPTLVTLNRVEGRGRLVIPAAGLPTLWAHEDRWELIAGLAVLVAGAMQVVGNDLRPTRLLARVGTARQARSRRRAASPGRARLARDRTAVAGLSLLVVTAGVFGTGQEAVAAFLGSTANSGSSFGAGSVPAPLNPSATGACVQPGAVRVINLAWDPVASASGYRVLRSSATGGPYAEVGTATTPAFQDDTVVAGSTYFYVVRSLAAPWESGNSTEITATAPQGCGGGGGGGGRP
jgi:signal peptidase